MARLLKNPDISTGSLGVKLPFGTTTLSDAPVTGLIRFNTDTNRIEFYYNNTWNQVAKIGSVQLNIDTKTGDGVTQVFAMSQSESDPTAIAVFIGGVYQQPTQHYTVSGYNITFNVAPPAPGINPNQIVIIHNLNSTNVAA